MFRLIDTARYRASLLAALVLGVALCVGASAAPYQARYDVVIESAAQRELSYGLMMLALPVAGAADVEPLDAADTRIVQDGMGNRQIELSLDRVPVRYRRVLSVVVSIADDMLEDRPAAEAAFSQSPGRRYLSAEPLVEVDELELREQSSALLGSDAAETVANVVSFIDGLEPEPAAAQIPADSPPGSIEGSAESARGALAALRSNSAGPADRALLTLALLRAASIPARAVAGFVDNDDGILAGDEMQLWVEYLSQNRWRRVGDADNAPRTIVFRIFASAEDISPGMVLDNFYRAAGLKMRSMY